MADALGFDPPAGLIEQMPMEEMLPLDEGDVADGAAEDAAVDAAVADILAEDDGTTTD